MSITANYPGSNPVEDRTKQVMGLANQIGYHGGVALSGAKLIAEYLVDLHNQVEELKSQVAELMAKENAREHAAQNAGSGVGSVVQRKSNRT